jgi:hypothetical protein
MTKEEIKGGKEKDRRSQGALFIDYCRGFKIQPGGLSNSGTYAATYSLKETTSVGAQLVSASRQSAFPHITLGKIFVSFASA